MTEDDWWNATDPRLMLDFLQTTGQLSDRKARLFAVACCRRIWDRIPESCNRDALVAVEELLEGKLPPEAVEKALTRSSFVERKPDGTRRAEPVRGTWARPTTRTR